MTNFQIITDIAAQVYGEDVVETLIAEGRDIPLHTAQGWKARGPFRIKKGEHGIECMLWKHKKNKVASSDKEEDDSQDSESHEKHGFYMCKSFLFRRDQVERVEW